MPNKQSNLSGAEALARLQEGNQRFANNVRSLDTLLSHTQRASLTEGKTRLRLFWAVRIRGFRRNWCLTKASAPCL